MIKLLSTYAIFIFLFISRLGFTLTTSSEQGFHAASSLIYHAYSLIDQLEGNQDPDSTEFTEKDLSLLWQKVAKNLNENNFQQAYDSFYNARYCLSANLNQEAQDALFHSISILKTIEEALPVTFHSLSTHNKSTDDGLKNNPYITSKVRKRIAPFLLPKNSPVREAMDSIFSFSRVSTNDLTLINAGFNILSVQPRSFIRILRHPLLPNLLLKAYVDCELRVKKDQESWEWLVKRCQGAKDIRYVIAKKKIKLFTVPDKWIYVFPGNSTSPNDGLHVRHLAILLVEDMHLTSFAECLYAWYNLITKKHLDELYKIISYAKGSSYRPDNIPFTIYGTFTFIDTEYPKHKPDYNSIKHFISPEMLQYWERLIRNGGP